MVWCHFPDLIHRRSKARPALIVRVYDANAPKFAVQVAYGTSKKTTELREFKPHFTRPHAATRKWGLTPFC
ncbi:MAG TPA: hypothetical protein VGE60_00110 [Telluria sp.]